jgi:uncharacterized protein YbaP (TraB family)
MARTWCLAALVVLSGFAFAVLPALPFSHGLLFRVEAPGKPSSFVFGTLHSNDSRVTAVPAIVTESLAASRYLAPEILVAQSGGPEFFEAAQFDDKRRLADFFDAETLARIWAALGDAAPAPDVFARLKPWAVLLLLAQPQGQAAGATLDEILVEAARRQRLHVIGLEMPQEQVASLDAIPVASQVAIVQWLLAHREQLPAEHEAVVLAWLARDLAGLATLTGAPGRADPVLARHFAQLTRHLVENRSALMAHRLYLPLREGRVFVAVGAMHLYGRQGLLELIRAQGYRIERVY